MISPSYGAQPTPAALLPLSIESCPFSGSSRVRVAIVGSGLAGLAAAVDLVDAGHQVDLYEARPFMGGKVGSWVDEGGNHIEMGLHVFFFNYANLFALLRKVCAIDNLLPKDHTHLFVNAGGDLRELDFRFALGAPFNGLKAFFTTPPARLARQAAQCPGAGHQPDCARFGGLRRGDEGDSRP